MISPFNVIAPALDTAPVAVNVPSAETVVVDPAAP